MTSATAQPPASPDFYRLLAPLDGQSKTGIDLRLDPIYHAIGEARREENARLPQGVWTHDVKRSDWALVEQLCTDVLLARSKDLQIASWLTEAWVHRLSFDGLAPGLGLLNGLCRRFWIDLHPQIEDGDLTSRLAPFEWLNTRIPILLRSLPIVVAANGPEESYTWTDYINAQLLEGLRQRDPKAVERSEAAGAVTLASFAAARSRTDTTFWRQLNRAFDAALKALATLDQTLVELCGHDAPGLGGVGDALRDLSNLIAVALGERETRPAAPPRPARPQAPANAVAPTSTAITTREQAYAQLVAIADFLQKLEPHSPTPYLIRRAIEWSHLSFAELLVTLARVGMQLDQVIEVLGLADLADDHHSAESEDSKI